MATQGTLTVDAGESVKERTRIGFAGRLRARLRAVTRRLRYGRMVQALSRLPDHQLAAIGLRRSAIPAHARRLVYEDD
jgi:uncharacterized protein YjiS (DUF1127 family)